MEEIKAGLILQILIVVSCEHLLHAHSGGTWTYATEGEEFPKWGGICDDGTKQSPINIITESAPVRSYPPLIFNNYDEEIHAPKIENTGYTVQLLADSPEMTIAGGPLQAEYAFINLHLHWGAEHTFDNIRYPLEMHVVHVKKEYAGNVPEALHHPDGIAVLSITFTSSTTEVNTQIEKIVKNLEAVASSSNIGKRQDISEAVILRDFIYLNELGDYYYYEGSLTTPGCEESVVWIVFAKLIPVGQEQVDRLKIIENWSGEKLTINYRQTQNQSDLPFFVKNTCRTSRASKILFYVRPISMGIFIFVTFVIL